MFGPLLLALEAQLNNRIGLKLAKCDDAETFHPHCEQARAVFGQR